MKGIAPKGEEDELEITGSWLRDLIETEGVLRGDYKAPSATRLQPLADRLNTLRALALLEKTGLRATDSPRIRAAMALQTLEEVLPILKGEYEGYFAHFRELDFGWWEDSPGVKVLMVHHRLLGEFMQAVETVSEALILKPLFESVRKIASWRDFAEEVGESFRQVLEATNPGKEIGVSNGGPVARFLAAITPHVTGENLNPDSIGRSLRRSVGKDKPV